MGGPGVESRPPYLLARDVDLLMDGGRRPRRRWRRLRAVPKPGNGALPLVRCPTTSPH